MVGRYETSSTWIQGVLDLFESQGVDTRTLCAEVGVSREALLDPAVYCPTDTLSLLWQRAIERSGDPALPLSAAAVVQPANYGVIAYVMMSSSNLLVGLERLVRYLRVVSTAVHLAIERKDDECWVVFDLIGGTHPAPRQRYEFDLLTLLTFCNWVSGRSKVVPRLVELAHASPHNADRHLQAFGCPVKFAAGVYRVRFRTADLLLPLPAANPVLAQLHERFALDKLNQIGAGTFDQRVRDAISTKLPDGEPHRDAIASALGMSARTLHRRLRLESTSYQEILDSTRHELAERYLRKDNLTIGQISFLLGFADQSNFHRACKRWLGTSPAQYRARHASPA